MQWWNIWAHRRVSCFRWCTWNKQNAFRGFVLCSWSSASVWVCVAFKDVSFLSVILNHPSSLRIQMTWLHGASILAVRPPSSLFILCETVQLHLIQLFHIVLCFVYFYSFLSIHNCLIFNSDETHRISFVMCTKFSKFFQSLRQSFNHFYCPALCSFTMKSVGHFVSLQLMTVSGSCQRSVHVLSTCTAALESSPPSTIHMKR